MGACHSVYAPSLPLVVDQQMLIALGVQSTDVFPTFAGVSEDERRAIVYGNARRFYALRPAFGVLAGGGLSWTSGWPARRYA
jgi:hypothetical protein